jgi:hypothetical protein
VADGGENDVGGITVAPELAFDDSEDATFLA